MPGRKAPEETRRQDILRAAYVVAAQQGVAAVTLRAVAERAKVSHGTVLFHFKRREQVVATLLARVLNRMAELRVPDAVSSLTRPGDQLVALVRSEMERVSTEPRHFRLFLEYWTLGLRNPKIRRVLNAALDKYRAGFRTLAESALGEAGAEPNGLASEDSRETAEGVAAVAVSLIHGCALHAVISPKGFAREPHFDAAARMLEGLVASPYAR